METNAECSCAPNGWHFLRIKLSPKCWFASSNLKSLISKMWAVSVEKDRRWCLKFLQPEAPLNLSTSQNRICLLCCKACGCHIVLKAAALVSFGQMNDLVIQMLRGNPNNFKIKLCVVFVGNSNQSMSCFSKNNKSAGLEILLFVPRHSKLKDFYMTGLRTCSQNKHTELQSAILNQLFRRKLNNNINKWTSDQRIDNELSNMRRTFI